MAAPMIATIAIAIWLVTGSTQPLAQGTRPHAPSGHGARAGRAGKVVRVERPRLLRSTDLRMCLVPFSDKSKGTCYGGAPRVDDTAALFDSDRVYLGAIKVVSTGPSSMDSCQSGFIFDFTFEFVSRPADATDSQLFFATAIFGMDIHPQNAKLVTDTSELPTPGTDPQAQPWMGVDQDGDGSMDMVMTAFECPGQVPPAISSGQVGDAFCLDYWLATSGQWIHVRRDHLYSCG